MNTIALALRRSGRVESTNNILFRIKAATMPQLDGQWVKVGDYANKRVVGVTRDGRQKIIRKCRKGAPVEFVREPNNRHDKNAVAVHVNGKQVGYLAADVAKWVANNMDGGRRMYRSKVADVSSFSDDDGKEIWTMDVTMEVYDWQESKDRPGEMAPPRRRIFREVCAIFGWK